MQAEIMKERFHSLVVIALLERADLSQSHCFGEYGV